MMAMSSYYSYPNDYYTPNDPYTQSIKECYDCVSMITENLYITNRNGANNYPMLQGLQINTIVSVTLPEHFRRPYYPDIDFIRVEVPDDPKFNIDRYFDDVAWDIHRVIRNGGRVLVHCYAGMSRSPTIVMAYLMKYGGLNFEGMTLSEAHRAVMAGRPVVQPNCGFWRQLIRYEKKLFNRNSVYMEDNGC